MSLRERVKPVRTEADYKEALALIDELIDSAPGTEEYDVLDLMSELVSLYEDAYERIGPPEPGQAIRFHMDRLSLNAGDMDRFFGGPGQTELVIAGAVPLTLEMVRRLHFELGIPADSLLGPSPPSKPAEVA